MIDIDIRALQIKRLDERKVANLHRFENEAGRRFLPFEIASRGRIPNLKGSYGVPFRKPKAEREWVKRVRGIVSRFIFEKQMRVNIENLESLHAFDLEVLRSDLDFEFTPREKKQTISTPVSDWWNP